MSQASGPQGTTTDAMEFYLSVGFVRDGTAQTQFGPAQRMRLDVASYGIGPSV